MSHYASLGNWSIVSWNLLSLPSLESKLLLSFLTIRFKLDLLILQRLLVQCVLSSSFDFGSVFSLSLSYSQSTLDWQYALIDCRLTGLMANDLSTHTHTNTQTVIIIIFGRRRTVTQACMGWPNTNRHPLVTSPLCVSMFVCMGEKDID